MNLFITWCAHCIFFCFSSILFWSFSPLTLQVHNKSNLFPECTRTSAPTKASKAAWKDWRLADRKLNCTLPNRNGFWKPKAFAIVANTPVRIRRAKIMGNVWPLARRFVANVPRNTLEIFAKSWKIPAYLIHVSTDPNAKRIRSLSSASVHLDDLEAVVK